MKVIDLLNKIANGEEVPKYIKYRDISKHDYDIMMTCKENIIYQLDQCVIDLNDEVEIIEEKKIPEKLEILSASDILDILGIKQTKYQQKAMQNLIIYLQKQSKKINEIIDCLKSKGE